MTKCSLCGNDEGVNENNNHKFCGSCYELITDRAKGRNIKNKNDSLFNSDLIGFCLSIDKSFG